MQKRLLQDVVSKDQSVRGLRFEGLYDTLPEREGATMRIPPRKKAPVDGHLPSTQPRQSKSRHLSFESSIPPRPPRTPFRSSGSASERPMGKIFGIGTLVVIGVILVGAFIAMSTVFAGATVTVYPKQAKDTLIDGSFVAQSKPQGTELSYTTLVLERVAEETVEATRQEQVEEFASGDITIFNTFDENPQRLIRNTRFEVKGVTTPEGIPLIYRIRDSIDVPGVSVNASGETVPGSVTVTVYADQPGEAYNLEQAEFSIPGFQGTSRFEKFYARTTAPLSGGFSGNRLTVEDAVKTAAQNRLHASIKEELMREITSGADMPEAKLFFPSGAFMTYESLPDQEQSEQSLSIRERGILTAILFDEPEFSSRMAASALADYDNNPVTISNPESLDVSVNRLETDDIEWDQDTYTVRVRGRITLLWLFNEDKLRSDLLGIENDQEILRSILFERHPGITRAEINNRPFWRSTLPDEPEDITITTLLD